MTVCLRDKEIARECSAAGKELGKLAFFRVDIPAIGMDDSVLPPIDTDWIKRKH